MKGLTLKLIISKKGDTDDSPVDNDNNDKNNGKENITEKIDGLDLEEKVDLIGNNTSQLCQMEVESSGKFSRKASWKDLERFCGKEIDSDTFRDWIVNYQGKCFPEDLEEPNHTPQKCYIKDENGFKIFKDFGWKAIKLNLKPGKVDVKEKWTREVFLETFPLDYSTNLSKILSLDKCDREIVSSLRKSKIAGHPLLRWR